MLAAVYHGPDDLRLEDVAIPQIGGDEILLKVMSASICGTDLRILHGNHRMYPAGTVRIPGHESVGAIAAIGERVTGYTIGQRVFAAPNTGCGHCRECSSGNNNRCANYQAIGVTYDGAFAEYMRIPAAMIAQGNLIPLAGEVDPAQAALTEPLACVLRGQTPLAIQPGEVVLVMGAGPIGILHTKLARLRGAGRVLVSEPQQERVEQAALLGADRAINPKVDDLPSIIASETNGRGADVIIVAAPAHLAMEQALQLAAVGGRINFFGALPKDRPVIQFDANLMHYKELLVTGTTACSTQDCWRAAEILNTGRLDLSAVISARFPLEQALTAFAAAENRKSLKIVIEP